ncbi:uncharacterized protein Fot_34758 [Forsythia ovata]|uniref:Uncharacterized protein n=1 Tax=Forsythia ovata TaxID=205694 RepID=A0ABD1SJX6_9LAMI
MKTNHDGADSNDLRELEDKANLKPPSNLMSLMQVYREAILNGDGKTVSDIEAKISIVEKEKNELVQKTNHDGADSNDLRELKDKANLKPPSNLMSLMQVYREAILNGDSKTVSDIEAKISIVEKEKNELVQNDSESRRSK